MPTAREGASALCVKQAPDVVLVIGGNNGNTLNCAELLYGDASQAGQPWRWRALSPMHKTRLGPGMLLLSGNEEIQRILVAGGYGQSAELLTISCTDTADSGQWTLIAPLSKPFSRSALVCFNGRIFAFGRCRFCLILSFRWQWRGQ